MVRVAHKCLNKKVIAKAKRNPYAYFLGSHYNCKSEFSNVYTKRDEKRKDLHVPFKRPQGLFGFARYHVDKLLRIEPAEASKPDPVIGAYMR